MGHTLPIGSRLGGDDDQDDVKFNILITEWFWCEVQHEDDIDGEEILYEDKQNAWSSATRGFAVSCST